MGLRPHYFKCIYYLRKRKRKLWEWNFLFGGNYKTISGVIAVSCESYVTDQGLLEGWIEIGERNDDNYKKL